MPKPHRRRICFVTGTRAEFGLMRSVLSAIEKSKKLKLQIVVTGMHLDRRHGRSIGRVGEEGWKIDAVAPWKGQSQADATGNAIAALKAKLAKTSLAAIEDLPVSILKKVKALVDEVGSTEIVRRALAELDELTKAR